MASSAAATQDAKPEAWSIFKPLARWQHGSRKIKVAHEGEQMQMYFHPELKKWVEKGREHEVAQDASSAPPPTGGLLPSLPAADGSTRAGSSRSRRPIGAKYVLQSNLSVSMDLDSMGSGVSAALLPPLLTSISPPASSSSFFIPTQGPAATDSGLAGILACSDQHASTSAFEICPSGQGFNCDAAPSGAAGLLTTSTEAPLPLPSVPSHIDTSISAAPGQYQEAPNAAIHSGLAPCSPDTPLLSFAAVEAANCCNNAAEPLMLAVQAPSSCGSDGGGASDCGSHPGSRSLHNGHKFAIPQPKPWGAAGCWPAAPSSVCDSVSSRDQDFCGHELSAFDAAMHPRNTGKLDGPLPWELPGQLRYSEDFVSICTAWQRRNPGRLYNPRMLLPAAAAVDNDVAAAGRDVAAAAAAVCLTEQPGAVDAGQRCAAEVVDYLQQVLQGLKARRDVPDADIKHAMALLSSLTREGAPRLAAGAGGEAVVVNDTPTKDCVTVSAVVKQQGQDVQQKLQALQTPQRLPCATAYMLDSSPEMETVVAKQVPARQHASKVPALTSQQLANLKKELQDDYEHKLAARTAEIEARFEARLSEMRVEMEAEYERRLAERDIELQAQRQRCEELQDDLDNLLLCLGQESRKVTDLSQAMADAGLDAGAITMSIEEEYALMDLPVSSA